MTPEELDALRLEVLGRSREKQQPTPGIPPEDRERLAELELELEALHARHVRHRGAAMASYARWVALQRLAAYLHRAEERRRTEAMHDAIEALERAKLAQEGKARWLRVGAWIARRVDEAAARVGRHTKLVTKIDFSQPAELADCGEELEPTDLQTDEEDEIQW